MDVIPHGSTYVKLVFHVVEIINFPLVILIDKFDAGRRVTVVLIDHEGDDSTLYSAMQIEVANPELIVEGDTCVLSHCPMVYLKEQSASLIFFTVDSHHQPVPRFGTKGLVVQLIIKGATMTHVIRANHVIDVLDSLKNNAFLNLCTHLRRQGVCSWYDLKRILDSAGIILRRNMTAMLASGYS